MDADEKNTDDNKGRDEAFDRGESFVVACSPCTRRAIGYKPRRCDDFFCPIPTSVWNVVVFS